MDAPWLRVARELIGIKKISVSKAAPRSVGLFRLAGFSQQSRDEIPWPLVLVKTAALSAASFRSENPGASSQLLTVFAIGE